MATAEVEEGPGEPASVEEVPSSWLGYSWYLVGSMGRGTKAGELEQQHVQSLVPWPNIYVGVYLL